jgi:hypothetical protein
MSMPPSFPDRDPTCCHWPTFAEQAVKTLDENARRFPTADAPGFRNERILIKYPHATKHLTLDNLSYVIPVVGSATGRIMVKGRMRNLITDQVTVGAGERIEVEVRVVEWWKW